MKKIMILGIVLTLAGCSSGNVNKNKTVDEIYKDAFENTFNSDYSYYSKTYQDDPSNYTITQCQYYIDDESNYISYTWSYTNDELTYGAISATAEEKLLKYEASLEQNYTLASSYGTIVTTKTNLFETEGIEIVEEKQNSDHELKINYTVSDMYIELTVQLSDNQIAEEECYVYEDADKATQLYYNDTKYYVESSDYASDFEQARSFKNQPIDATLTLQK